MLYKKYTVYMYISVFIYKAYLTIMTGANIDVKEILYLYL